MLDTSNSPYYVALLTHHVILEQLRCFRPVLCPHRCYEFVLAVEAVCRQLQTFTVARDRWFLQLTNFVCADYAFTPCGQRCRLRLCRAATPKRASTRHFLRRA